MQDFLFIFFRKFIFRFYPLNCPPIVGFSFLPNCLVFNFVRDCSRFSQRVQQDDCTLSTVARTDPSPCQPFVVMAQSILLLCFLTTLIFFYFFLFFIFLVISKLTGPRFRECPFLFFYAVFLLGLRPHCRVVFESDAVHVVVDAFCRLVPPVGTELRPPVCRSQVAGEDDALCQELCAVALELHADSFSVAQELPVVVIPLAEELIYDDALLAIVVVPLFGRVLVVDTVAVLEFGVRSCNGTLSGLSCVSEYQNLGLLVFFPFGQVCKACDARVVA